MKRYVNCVNSKCIGCEAWLCATNGTYTGEIRCAKCGCVNIFQDSSEPVVLRATGSISSGMVQQLRWEGELAIEKLARLLALLEDRESIAKLIWVERSKHLGAPGSDWDMMPENAVVKETYRAVADRLASYIKERL